MRSPIRATTPPPGPVLFFLIWLHEKYFLGSAIQKAPGLLHSPVTSSLLAPDILLRTLFSNTINLIFFLNERNQVSFPYKTGKIIIIYVLIFIYLDSKLEDKIIPAEI